MFLSIGFISITSFGQAPDGINYQAVIRKTSGTLLTNSPVAIRVQIKQTSATRGAPKRFSVPVERIERK